MNKEKISILLATYQGANYIREQIQSVLDQTYLKWELFVRDDCSSDSTLSIIREFVAIDERIKIVPNNDERLGACQNFSELMRVADVDSYIMFCDQDDIWLPNKLHESIKAMKILESNYGQDKNFVVYGNYSLMNHQGKPLSIPNPDYSTKPTLQLLLSQNYIYGCTMLINKKLLNLSSPIPQAAENHDYWIALTALVNDGYFIHINEPLLYYRQHLNNVSGSYKNAFFKNRLSRIFSTSEIMGIRSRLRMFTDLYEKFKDTMTDKNRTLVSGYINSVEKGGVNAVGFCAINGIRRRGLVQTSLFYINLFRS